MWKRKNAALTYSWGTFGMHSYHEPLRPGFYGEMKRSKSGRLKLQYPRWKTLCKEYLVSYPLMGLLAVAYLGLIVLETYFNAIVTEVHEREGTMASSVMTYVPSAVYGILVYLLSSPTRSLAAALTSWGWPFFFFPFAFFYRFYLNFEKQVSNSDPVRTQMKN